MNKILITTEGGMVTSVVSDDPTSRIVIVDYDKNADYEDDISVSDVLEPDFVAGKIYELFNGSKDKQEQVLFKKLNELNF